MRTRKWLLVPVVVVILAVILLLVARATLTPARVRALVEPRLEAALRRPVELGAIRVRTLPIAVHVEDVVIGAPAGFSSPQLLRIGSLELHPRLLPLLRKQILIRRVRVSAPEVWVEQRADSLWNWAAPPGAAGAPAPSAGAATRAQRPEFAIETLEIERGVVHVAAAPTGLALDVPLAAAIGLRADPALHDVRLSGSIDADSMRAAFGTRRDLRLPRLRLEPEVRLDVPESTATIERLRVVVNRAAIDVTGTARTRHGKPELHLATRGESVDLAELLAALPPGTQAARGLVAAGTARFDLRTDIVPGAPPVARGTIELQGGSLQAAQLPEKVSDLGVRIELAGDSLRVHDVTARVGDAPVRITGLVLDAMQPARTRYDLRIAAALDLARLARVAPLPPGVTLAGRADLDVRARGRTARPDSVVLEGPVTLRDVVVQTPQLLQPVRANARLQGAGTALRIESARLAAGTSEIALTGAFWPALPPRRPRLELEGTTSRLDLVALLPKSAPPARKTATASPDTTPAGGARPATAALVPILPAVDARLHLAAREVVLQGTTLHDADLDIRSDGVAADVELRAKTLRAGDTTLHDATGTLRAADRGARGRVRAARATLHRIEATQLESDVEIDGRTIRLPTLQAQAYAGRLRGTTVLDLSDPAKPRYDLDTVAEKLQCGAFLGSLTPLGNAVTGSLDLTSGWKFSGPGPQLVRQSLTGSGQAASVNGRIADLPVVTELATLLQMPSLKTIPYRDLGLQFAVDSGRLSMRDCVVHGNDADFGVGGSVGLDGSLDLALAVTLSQELSRRALGARGAGALSSLFTDASGRLVFDVRVGGTHRSPRLQLDLQKTAGRAGIAALTDNVLRRLLGGRLPAPAPAPAPNDSGPTAGTAEDLRQRALEEARKKLGGKLGGLLGGGSRPDTTSRSDTTRRPD